MKYDSIIFDLDGTLWDSTEGVEASWKKILKTQPDITAIPTHEEFQGVMGLTSDKLMAALFPYISYERGQELFSLCCEVENEYLSEHGGALYGGVIEMLAALSKQIPLFIVSNCNDGYIECFLKAHDTKKYFQDWECIGRTGLSKAENIRLVMKRNRLENPVYVGDTVWDYESAAKAGVPFIHAAYGFGRVEHVQKINSPGELLSFI